MVATGEFGAMMCLGWSCCDDVTAPAMAYNLYKWANALVPPTPVNGLGHRSRCMRMCAGFFCTSCMYAYIYILYLEGRSEARRP